MQARLLKEIEEEVTQLLSGLIRIDTTNPPGNETQAAQYLSEYLSREGLDCKIYESEPNRGNIVTRLKGTGEKPSLLLLSHLDVVAANAEEWSVNPFGGIVKDGYVWGRGALDMKGMTAIEVMTLLLLKRNNVKLKGDVVLAATADEEQGGLAGADFLLRNYREKVVADYVLNEGGGLAVPVRGRNVYTVQTAEKGLLWFKVKAKGIPGHGSLPHLADNAILRMNRVIETLGNCRFEVLFPPTVRKFLSEVAVEDLNLQELFSRLLANPYLSDQLLCELAASAKPLADEIWPRTRITITPTVIRGGMKENVVPSECEAVFDCRILPGQNTAEAFGLIKNLLKEAGVGKLDFEVIQANEPSESPMETPLYEVITSVLKAFEHGCGVAPALMTGGTDSRFFRRIGSVCYGFHPMRPEVLNGRVVRREHGVDERISVENLVFGASVLYEVVKRFLS
ncbi:MAG: M20/M25/M40 family metallo-hydrolase [Candidatus Bathyarchaeota archaeon]|nr:M20/M25/M40 family metallo-hydrolase [Candidatus Bathyarchaeota archaeon]